VTLLEGKRILVVEDEVLVAYMAEEFLLELGAIVVGPAYRVSDGLVLAEREKLDAAVLDVNMDGSRSDPIADVLKDRAIPFVLSTGYGEVESKRGVPVLDKPYTAEALGEVLRHVMSTG
jgi:CheY-like chemotaxis protein